MTKRGGSRKKEPWGMQGELKNPFFLKFHSSKIPKFPPRILTHRGSVFRGQVTQ